MVDSVRYIVDEEGEILREISKNAIVYDKGQLNIATATEKITMDFLKVNPKTINKIDLNLKYVVILLDYVEFRTGILRYKNGRQIRKIKDFSKIFGISEQVVYRVIKDLINRDIIHKRKDEEGHYYFLFNPYIAHKGDRVSRDLVKEFYNTEWRYSIDN